MSSRSNAGRAPHSAAGQVALSLLIGTAVALPVAALAGWELLPLLIWDLTALAYLILVWSTIWPADAHETARRAAREDPSRGAADLIVLGAAVASLVAVGFVLVRAASSQGSSQSLLSGFGVASVAVSWAVVHTIYTLRYTRAFYGVPRGGVDFNEQALPDFADFAYLAFTIGMTFQVSDTSLQTKTMRRLALPHGLLSYLFSTCILATTINLIASSGAGGH